jgi:hypothetical protein
MFDKPSSLLLDVDRSIWTNKGKNVHIGRAKAEVKTPGAGIDLTKPKAHASLGKVSGELTVANASGKLGPVDGKVTLGTVNAHAVAEAKVEGKGSKTAASLKVGAGAEAMAVNARVGFEASITPKTVGDAVGGAYNDYVDPVVDSLAGRDMPEIPPVHDSYDHGIVVGAHAESGFGVSAKVGFEAEASKSGAKVGFKAKAGVGKVLGGGFTLGVK